MKKENAPLEKFINQLNKKYKSVLIVAISDNDGKMGVVTSHVGDSFHIMASCDAWKILQLKAFISERSGKD